MRDRPEPPECGRRPDAHLPRRTCDGSRGLLRCVRFTGQNALQRNRCRRLGVRETLSGVPAPIGGRFCEACGHDSALPVEAGAASRRDTSVNGPRSSPPTGSYYKRVIARGGPDTVEFPEFFPERRISLRDNSALIGRHNRGPGRGTRDRPGHPPRRPRGVHATRGVCGSETPARRSPIWGRPTEPASTTATICWPTARKPHSPTATASTSARGPRSRSSWLRARPAIARAAGEDTLARVRKGDCDRPER